MGGPAAARTNRRRGRLSEPVKGLVGVLIVGMVWQFAAILGFMPPAYFPTATTVLGYALTLVVQPVFLSHVVETLASMLLGLLIAAALAVPLGVLLGRFRVAYRLANTLVEAMRPIPALALTPVAILVFGLTSATTVSLVVWTASWPILINSVYGMHSVDRVALETARSFGFGRWQLIYRVALPSAAPFIATGIRIAIGIGLAVTVATEMITGAGNGVGAWIVVASSGGSLLPVYAAAVLVGLLGYLLNYAFERLERRVFAWHHSFRGEGV